MSRGPLLRRLNKIISKDFSRFYVPGHKGHPVKDAFRGELFAYDLTEIPGADCLYEAEDILGDMENRVARIYGAGDTLLSCGGSTLAIQTMLGVCASENSTVIMGRNAHVSAVNAAALIGFNVEWLYPRRDAGEGLPGRIHPQDVAAALARYPKAAAVYLTSPDYYGILCNIPEIARVCGLYGVPLLVDNAHGAHLHVFEGYHPLAQGADMCAESAHKTLPALTGSAFLHIRKRGLKREAKARMAVFGSTSPSYLMMASMDSCMDYLEGGGRLDYIRLALRIRELRRLAGENGFLLPQGRQDPIRLAINGRRLGYSGGDLANWLRRNRIEPEYVGGNTVVLVPTPHNREKDFSRLEKAICEIPEGPSLPPVEDMPLTQPRRGMSIRQAFSAPSQVIPVEEVVGRVAAESKCPCPPGVPLVMAGEILSENLGKQLKSAGVFSLKVVK